MFPSNLLWELRKGLGAQTPLNLYPAVDGLHYSGQSLSLSVIILLNFMLHNRFVVDVYLVDFTMFRHIRIISFACFPFWAAVVISLLIIILLNILLCVDYPVHLNFYWPTFILPSPVFAWRRVLNPYIKIYPAMNKVSSHSKTCVLIFPLSLPHSPLSFLCQPFVPLFMTDSPPLLSYADALTKQHPSSPISST